MIKLGKRRVKLVDENPSKEPCTNMGTSECRQSHDHAVGLHISEK